MPSQHQSPALRVARAHVEAWSKKDWGLTAFAEPIMAGSVPELAGVGDDATR